MTGFPAAFLEAYIITLAVETAMLYMLLYPRYSRGLIVRNSLIVNTITLPFVWFVFPPLLGPLFGYAIQLAASELFALMAEAAMYIRLFPMMEARDAILVSFICNLCSFVIGLPL